jgi:hypothetical protein
MSEALRLAPRLSRSTLRKTCAEARSGGVFSAARHSGRHISWIRRGVWSKRSSSSLTLQSVCSCQPIQRAVVEKRARLSLSSRAGPWRAAARRPGAAARAAAARRDEVHAAAGRVAHLQRQLEHGLLVVDAGQRIRRRVSL